MAFNSSDQLESMRTIVINHISKPTLKIFSKVPQINDVSPLQRYLLEEDTSKHLGVFQTKGDLGELQENIQFYKRIRQKLFLAQF